VSRAALALGLPMATLRTWLVKLGVTRRGRGRPKGHAYRPELPELVELHGGMLTPIGAALGLTAERARQLIGLAGLDERAEQLREARRLRALAVQEAEREALTLVKVCMVCRRTFRTVKTRVLTCGAECSRERKLAITRKRVLAIYYAKKAKVDVESAGPTLRA